jgi:hypothetical protein
LLVYRLVIQNLILGARLRDGGLAISTYKYVYRCADNPKPILGGVPNPGGGHRHSGTFPCLLHNILPEISYVRHYGGGLWMVKTCTGLKIVLQMAMGLATRKSRNTRFMSDDENESSDEDVMLAEADISDGQ